MAHAQKPDSVFRLNVRVHLNRRARQFSRLLTAEVCASAVVMLDTPCSEVVWRVLATHSICQFPLHFPSRASPCAITFQLDSTTTLGMNVTVTTTLGMNVTVTYGLQLSKYDRLISTTWHHLKLIVWVQKTDSRYGRWMVIQCLNKVVLLQWSINAWR